MCPRAQVEVRGQLCRDWFLLFHGDPEIKVKSLGLVPMPLLTEPSLLLLFKNSGLNIIFPTQHLIEIKFTMTYGA